MHGHAWAVTRFGDQPGIVPTRTPGPIVTFDYRCHTPGGSLGTRFPPVLQSCLAKLGAADGAAAAAAWGFDETQAAFLQRRAELMLSKGMEGAIDALAERQPAFLKFPLQRPCCAVDRLSQCLAPFETVLDDGQTFPWAKPRDNETELASTYLGRDAGAILPAATPGR